MEISLNRRQKAVLAVYVVFAFFYLLYMQSRILGQINGKMHRQTVQNSRQLRNQTTQVSELRAIVRKLPDNEDVLDDSDFDFDLDEPDEVEGDVDDGHVQGDEDLDRIMEDVEG